MSMPAQMHAMVLAATGRPLERRELPVREPAAGELLIEVRACGVCRTDLHVADGELRELPVREPAAGELLIEVRACGVCRTDLHVADGELREPKLPLVPGHEIIGTVAAP